MQLSVEILQVFSFFIYDSLNSCISNITIQQKDHELLGYRSLMGLHATTLGGAARRDVSERSVGASADCMCGCSALTIRLLFGHTGGVSLRAPAASAADAIEPNAGVIQIC